MKLTHLHKSTIIEGMIIEGIIITEDLINEDWKRTLLAVAKGLGRIIFKAVTTLIKAGMYFSAALALDQDHPGVAYNQIERDLQVQIDQLPEDDPKRETLIQAKHAIEWQKNQSHYLGQKCGSDVPIWMAQHTAEIEQELAGQVADPYQRIIQSVQNTRDLIEQEVGPISISGSFKNNQNFVMLPFGLFNSKLESKCEVYGIAFSTTEESYTSKCDHLVGEEMVHHDHYLGKRIKRGLFRSSRGLLLNADVNGAIGIIRKSKHEVDVNRLVSRGWITQPSRIDLGAIRERSAKSIVGCL